MNGIKKTVLHDRHIALGGMMVEFAGYNMPLYYTNIAAEHHAIRERVGMFDVSHMGEIRVSGPDATKFVNHLCTNDFSSLPAGRLNYTLFCYENGGCVDDSMVYKMSEDEYFLVVNASNVNKDFDWICSNKGEFDVEIENQSDFYGQIALQGPQAEEMFQQMVQEDLSKIPFLGFSKLIVFGRETISSRSGYTGEDGFEIYAENALIEEIWDHLVKMVVVPCGLGCRDTLRFEAALPLYGHEIDSTISPLEAGLGFAVKLDKVDFIGKDALVSQKQNGLPRKMVGIELIEKNIPRQGYVVYSQNEQEIGIITTGYLSPSSGLPIANALIMPEFSKMGTQVFVQIRKKMIPAKIRDRKFIQKKYKKGE